MLSLSKEYYLWRADTALAAYSGLLVAALPIKFWIPLLAESWLHLAASK